MHPRSVIPTICSTSLWPAAFGYEIGRLLPCMEVGSPEARYALVEIHGTRVRASHFCIPYDHEKAALLAERAGSHEWGTALRTG
jgi:hypothetical protein